MDYLVRATAAEGMLRAFAVTDRDTVEAARAAHNTSPVATAALGRLMSAALMMGTDIKEEDGLITLKVNCDGPIGGLLATADAHGNVKGYVNEPNVLLHANALGKLDVGGALGTGVLSVIKDIGLKEPYVGQTMLVSGEIAEDITYYFAASEQIPSSVALGVLMNRNNTVRCAGGFLVQLMPGAPEELIGKLEDRLKTLRPVTTMLDMGLTPEDMLREVLAGLAPEINEKLPVRFHCNCSHERVEKALISIGKKELSDMIADGKEIETVCHFCGKKYCFSVDELKTLLEKAKG
ncbi:MAG: Hsp33 family molecular chaperone HslO [Eubacteriales bacterium]|nr:Hsp33 family molecular chaperone HslO [Eubacteriales bacterium]